MAVEQTARGDDWEKLRSLIRETAIEVKEEGFILASGMKSKLYIDLRKVTQHSLGINLIARLVFQKVGQLGERVDCVGGLETGSIPIATAVSMLSLGTNRPLSGFWVRKKPKDHGLQNTIEGNLNRGDNALIVEDTATTGGSSLRAVEAVRTAGANVIQAISIVDRGARPNFEKVGIPYFAFYSESDLLAK